MGRKSRFTHEQVEEAFKQVERGATVVDVCHQLGIAPKTYYRWRAATGGPEISEAKRHRQLEEENRRLRRLITDQALSLQLLTDQLERTPMDANGWHRDRNGHVATTPVQ